MRPERAEFSGINSLAPPLQGSVQSYKSIGRSLPWVLCGFSLPAAVLAWVSGIRPLLLLGGFGVAVSMSWLMLRHPAATLMVFWFTYCIKTTVLDFTGVTQGLFYAIYAVMLINSVRALMRTHNELKMQPAILVSYLVFMVLVTIGTIWSPIENEMAIAQRLFIYSLGIVAAMQVRSDSEVTLVLRTAALTGLVVAIWTISQASAGDYGYRGSVDVNPNYVSTVIGVGVLVLIHELLREDAAKLPVSKMLVLAMVGVQIYAIFLLASRGVVIAVVIGAIGVVVAGLVRKVTRSALVVVAIAGVALFLLTLPGAENVIVRWDEDSVGSMSERLPLWQIGLEEFEHSSVVELLLGRGMGATERLVQERYWWLTSIHNGFLQIALEYGLIGLFVFSAFFVLGTWVAIRSLRGGAIRLGLVWFWFVVSLTATVADGFLFWVFLGLILREPRDSGEEMRSYFGRPLARLRL